MKKGIRIFLMIVVVVLVFAGVQWVPNIVNQMQEKKDLGQAGCDYERFNIEKEYRNAIIVCRKNGYFVGIAKSALFV